MIATTITQSRVEPMDLTAQLNQFFMEHEKKAYTIAFMSLKHQEDAMDVVQDVMIKFVQKYKSKNTNLWAPLFFRMIQNRITDFHRQNSRKNKYFSFFSQEDKNEVDNVVDDSYVSAIKEIENEIQINHLKDALEKLPTRQLQAFMCRIWEGLSVAETARSMKCSQGSVKTHLFRALRYIRTQVQDNG